MSSNPTGFPIRKIIHVAKMTNVAGMERHLLTLLPGLHNCGLDVSLIILVEADKPLDAYAEQMRAAYDNVVGGRWRQVVSPLLAPYAMREAR